MVNTIQLLHEVIRPALAKLNLWSKDAEALVLATGLAESGLTAITQESGPARGLWQMEQPTHDDIWDNFLKYHGSLKVGISSMLAPWPDSFNQLAGNLYYAAAMCRVRYLRVPEPLPSGHDLQAMGAYWKKWYNTPLGKGTPEEFVTRASLVTDPLLWS